MPPSEPSQANSPISHVYWGRTLCFRSLPFDPTQILHTSTIQLKYAPFNVIQLELTSEPLCRVLKTDENNYQVETGPGAIPILKEHVQSIGRRLNEKSIMRDPKRTYEFDPGEDIKYPSIARMLCESNEGIIHYGGGRVQLTELLVEICWVFSRLKILIVVNSREEQDQLLETLDEYPFQIESRLSSSIESSGFVAVITTEQSELRQYITFEPSIILHLISENQVATFPASSKTLRRKFPLVRDFEGSLYGLISLDQRITPSRMKWIHLWFGERTLTIPEPHRIQLPLRFLFHKWRNIPSLQQNEELGILENGIVKNSMRNACIASIARTMASPPLLKSEKQPSAKQNFLNELSRSIKQKGTRRVAVLTDHLEQACDLARRLHWPIVSKCDPETVLDKRVKALMIQGQSNPGGHHHVITLPGGFSLKGIRSFDVYIRADGGRGLPPWGSHHPSVRDRTKPPQYGPWILDFDDDHHALLRRRTKSRQTAYYRQDWKGFIRSSDAKTLKKRIS